MEEIKIFLDKELSKEINGIIELGTVVAGESTERKIYVQNQTSSKLNLNLFLEGENISLVKEIKELASHKVEEVVFELKPNITIVQPIRAKLKIKLNYVVG